VDWLSIRFGKASRAKSWLFEIPLYIATRFSNFSSFSRSWRRIREMSFSKVLRRANSASSILASWRIWLSFPKGCLLLPARISLMSSWSTFWTLCNTSVNLLAVAVKWSRKKCTKTSKGWYANTLARVRVLLKMLAKLMSASVWINPATDLELVWLRRINDQKPLL